MQEGALKSKIFYKTQYLHKSMISVLMSNTKLINMILLNLHSLMIFVFWKPKKILHKRLLLTNLKAHNKYKLNNT